MRLQLCGKSAGGRRKGGPELPGDRSLAGPCREKPPWAAGSAHDQALVAVGDRNSLSAMKESSDSIKGRGERPGDSLYF